MAQLSLKISVIGSNVVKTMQFDPSTIVYDACKIIRERIQEASQPQANPSAYGLFLADEDVKKGVWLESGRTLDYYLLRNGDLLEYRSKHRTLRVRMLDGAVKTLQVDDSHTVSQLMITICSKIGIMNHEEYSLVHELADEEKEKTLTLRRDRSTAKDQKKLDEMKKKLHTDDELNWLDLSKTLREQAIDLNETLLLRRKFFFSDQNIDARDPVQLNLLYVQLRDAIIKGAHPVTQDEAVQFAGFQCQIQFGDHVETKHKPGFLDLKEFLPKEYVKSKGIEKKIWAEHRQLIGLTDIDGKVKYTVLARSLKTYGITFFLVKEKMKGKNKLVPRLLGITKESVVRVDEKTKEILKTWPLTTVLRWAASANSFTLDFGDYSASYYSVQTMEGEQITQLIAGYIDIIVKKKKDPDHLGIEGDEESAMFEDRVSPAKATIMQHQSVKVGHATTGSKALPGVLRTHDGTGQHGDFSAGSLSKAQHSLLSQHAHAGHAQPTGGQNVEQHGLGQAQRALLGTISSSLSAVEVAQSDLMQKAELPPLGNDQASMKWRDNAHDMSVQNVGAQLSAMGAATAQVVTLTSGGQDNTDYNAVGSAVATISSNIGEFSRDVRMLAALDEQEGGGEDLMDAARRLAGAISELLNATQPGTVEPRSNLLTAANRVGEASHDIMGRIGDETDKTYEETLLALAKAVANATATLVLKAKGVAGKCDNQADQNKVIGSATHAALATAQLVACTKVVAPTIHNPACQEQLVEAAKHVAKSVHFVVNTAQDSCTDEPANSDLRDAASAVSAALNDLLQQIKVVSVTRKEVNEVDTILTATDRLTSCMGDTPEMVRQARILAQATSMLVNDLKCEAESNEDSEHQKKLLAAAKVLADATARMVEAAKGCASQPQDLTHQQALRQAAEELRSATSAAATSASKKQVITQLEAAAKNAAAAATQLINTSNGAAPFNRNQSSQQQLFTDCKQVAEDVIPKLVHAIKGTMKNPDDPNAQAALIKACQDLIPPGETLVTSARAAVPTVSEPAAAISLGDSSRHLAAALGTLLTATTRAQETCGSQEIDSALYQVRRLEGELEDIRKTAADGKLMPLPSDHAENCASQLGATSKTVGSSMAQLLTAAAQGNDNYTGLAARDTANALEVLAGAVRGVAATTDDRAMQQRITEAAIDVMDKSANLIAESKKAVNNPNNPDNQTRLAQVAKAVSYALNNCVNCLPGLRDVDTAVKQITTISQKLATIQFAPSDRSFSEIQTDLNGRAVRLNEAATDIVTASRDNPNALAPSCGQFGGAYRDFVDGGVEMARATNDAETRDQIVNSLKSVSLVSSKLLMTTRSLLADPNAPNIKNLLAQAARAVTESINQLINICTVSAPGQKECDNALRQMQMMRPMLDNPSEAANDGTYFQCLDGVIDKSRHLGDAMTGISNHAKQGELDEFCVCVKQFADAVCSLTENCAQAAYLVGIADPASEPGRPGLVDQAQFARSNQAIQTACQNLSDPNSRPQVLSVATIVAKHTSSVCNSCRVASSKTSNPVAKRHFVQSAKDVANSTANLVRAIKELDGNFTEENRQRCAEAAKPLLTAVDELTTFASSPQFCSVPAKISNQARVSQEGITSSGKSLLDGACNMIQAAKLLAAQPRDPPTYHLYSNHSYEVSDAIKRLVAAIKESALGQKECEAAIIQVNEAIRKLDHASLAAVGQNLSATPGTSLQASQQRLSSTASMLLGLIDPIRGAAKWEAEKLGHIVTSLGSYFEPMATDAIGCASKMMNSKQQMSLLDQTKTAAESALQLLYAAREGSGNPKAVQVHSAIDEAADGAKEMVQELIQTLEQIASQAGIVNNMVDTISRSIARTEESSVSNGNMSYVDFQTNIVQLAKQIAKTAQEMSVKSGTNVADLGGLANMLTNTYNQLAAQTSGAVNITPNTELGSRLKVIVQQLGNKCIELVQDAGNLQSNPSDVYSKKELMEHAKAVSEKVSRLLAALQAGSKGTQECINAASTVSGIIGDLDTTIMFATAGTLNAEGEEEAFSDHRENILKTAKALVEDTKTLVAGAASNQEQLASAARSAVITITELADCVKHGAASIGSEQPEAQVLLINAVKDVATALADLINATKNSSGKSVNDPSMSMLKDSAKVMVTNVTSLLKTVKTVEDEAARGTRALESTVEAISQEIKNYVSTDHVEQKISPEELIRITKPMTVATAKAVAAGNSCRQEDAIVAANLGRRTISDLLRACKGASATAETRELKQHLLESGRLCSTAYRDLLVQVNKTIQKPSPASKQALAALSKQVASAVTEIIHSAETIKGSDWVDPDDPTVIAEQELLGAANSIEAAAKKLAQLQARKMPKQADESLNFDEQILEAAKSIATATAALVKAASSAQAELIAQGKIGTVNCDLEEDSQWSEGLISAARMVAAATHSLCDTANSMVQGTGSEEKLISAAKQVASSTAHLLVACRVKADADSAAMRRLQAAGNAVKRATDALVKAAQQVKQDWYYEESDYSVDLRMVGGLAEIIKAKETIYLKEKELEGARRKLENIRRAKYKGRSPDGDDDDNDLGSSF